MVLFSPTSKVIVAGSRVIVFSSVGGSTASAVTDRDINSAKVSASAPIRRNKSDFIIGTPSRGLLVSGKERAGIRPLLFSMVVTSFRPKVR